MGDMSADEETAAMVMRRKPALTPEAVAELRNEWAALIAGAEQQYPSTQRYITALLEWGEKADRALSAASRAQEPGEGLRAERDRLVGVFVEFLESSADDASSASGLSGEQALRNCARLWRDRAAARILAAPSAASPLPAELGDDLPARLRKSAGSAQGSRLDLCREAADCIERLHQTVELRERDIEALQRDADAELARKDAALRDEELWLLDRAHEARDSEHRVTWISAVTADQRAATMRAALTSPSAGGGEDGGRS